MSDVLTARNLRKLYQMGEVEVHALRGVDFELRRGELLVLLGASGSGKSTLLNIVGGLDVPTSGEVFYEDRSLSLADEAELTNYRREHVGFVFQFYNLIPSLTAAENVALVTELSDRSMDPLEALGLVGLGERADHFPSQLSGGEQQRVAIARAIVHRPQIILADEPTANLDRDSATRVLSTLKAFHGVGVTCVISTHDEYFLDRADRVVCLDRGKVVDTWRKQAVEGAA